MGAGRLCCKREDEKYSKKGGRWLSGEHGGGSPTSPQGLTVSLDQPAHGKPADGFIIFSSLLDSSLWLRPNCSFIMSHAAEHSCAISGWFYDCFCSRMDSYYRWARAADQPHRRNFDVFLWLCPLANNTDAWFGVQGLQCMSQLVLLLREHSASRSFEITAAYSPTQESSYHRHFEESDSWEPISSTES